jgi:hypothetical protein
LALFETLKEDLTPAENGGSAAAAAAKHKSEQEERNKTEKEHLLELVSPAFATDTVLLLRRRCLLSRLSVVMLRPLQY